MQAGKNQSDGPYSQSEAERGEASRDSFWNAAGTLYRDRRVLIAVPLAIATIAALITLLIPNTYRSSATVLIPETSGGGLSAAIFSNLPSAAASLLGGSSGDYVRYMAILQSRSVLSAAVDSFDLVQVYELEEEDHPRETAIKTLRDNIEVSLDQEFDYLSITASDTDPERAASLANFFVRRLNERNAQLVTQNAANYRTFIQNRYLSARADMDSVLDATVRFQQEHGVYNLPVQAESFFEQVAALRASALEAEIQYESLRAQYGPDNPQVRAFREMAQSANRKYADALEGRERLMPIAQSEVPSVGRRYVNLEIERTIQQTILEVLAPMYEHARLQEEQESQAVQVLDEAVPPITKAGPKRTLITLASGLSALVLTVMYLLALNWWRDNHAQISRRLEPATSREAKETYSA